MNSVMAGRDVVVTIAGAGDRLLAKQSWFAALARDTLALTDRRATLP